MPSADPAARRPRPHPAPAPAPPASGRAAPVGNRATTSLTARITAFTLAYSTAGAAASLLQDQAATIGLYWPAAGVAVGGLLSLPRRAWPGFLGALLGVQVVFHLLVGQDPVTLMIWSMANLVGHVLVATLVLRWRADRLDTLRAVTAFGAAALLGTIPAAVLGAIGSLPAESRLEILAAAGGWLVGDLLGVLTAAPVVLACTGRIPFDERRRTELLLMLGASIAITAALFTRPDPGVAAQLSYLVLLPLLWAAIRLKVAAVALAVLTSTVIAVVGTSMTLGPFAVAAVPVAGQSALLHLFLSGMTATALLLAARTVESETYSDVADDRAHLLATVSHELRTPLTPIVGFSELLISRGEHLDATTRTGLDAILRNGNHLTALVDDLLLLQQARQDRITADRSHLDLVTLVEGHLEARSDAHPVALRTVDGPVEVVADPKQIEQILANLVGNAFRHGAPPVSVELTTSDAEVALTVVDHGDGVAGWFAPQLFDAFSQQVVGDQRPSIGLGLGLAICRDLAAANGGTLHHEDDPAGGSRFTLRLARVTSAAAATTAGVAKSS